MNRKSSYLNIEFLSACTEARLYPEDFGHEVAICGRSNSGKSSIINALANSKKLAKTSNTPGRTQSINFFRNSRDALKGVILIMDIRHPFQEADYNFLEWCQSYNLPIQLLLNKADKLSRNKSLNILNECIKDLDEYPLLDEPQIFSAKNFDGVDVLVKKIRSWVGSPLFNSA